MTDHRARIADLDQQIGDLYNERRRIMEQFAVENGPAVLPAPTRRTDKQKLVARCPRCGGKIPDEGETR